MSATRLATSWSLQFFTPAFQLGSAGNEAREHAALRSPDRHPGNAGQNQLRNKPAALHTARTPPAQAPDTPARGKPGAVRPLENRKAASTGADGWLRSVSNVPDQPLPKSRRGWSGTTTTLHHPPKNKKSKSKNKRSKSKNKRSKSKSKSKIKVKVQDQSQSQAQRRLLVTVAPVEGPPDGDSVAEGAHCVTAAGPAARYGQRARCAGTAAGAGKTRPRPLSS